MKKPISKWQVIVTYILVIGLILLTVYVGKTQIYRGRAELDVARTFSVTDPANQPVSCTGTACTTDADEVTIQFNEAQMQDLLNSLP